MVTKPAYSAEDVLEAVAEKLFDLKREIADLTRRIDMIERAAAFEARLTALEARETFEPGPASSRSRLGLRPQ